MPVATGEATICFVSRCAERTHISRLRTGEPSVGDHVDMHAQPVGMQPQRLLHPGLAVERVERRLRVQHHPPARIDRLAPGLEQIVDVALFDLVPAQFDLDRDHVADQARRPRN